MVVGVDLVVFAVGVVVVVMLLHNFVLEDTVAGCTDVVCAVVVVKEMFRIQIVVVDDGGVVVVVSNVVEIGTVGTRSCSWHSVVECNIPGSSFGCVEVQRSVEL